MAPTRLLWILLATICLFHVASSQHTTPASLTDVLNSFGEALTVVVESVEADYLSKCDALSRCSEACSIPACGEDFPGSRGFQCTANFGNHSVCEDKHSCRGLVRSLQESTVQLPKNANFSNKQLVEFVCVTKKSEQAMKNVLQNATTSGSGWVRLVSKENVVRMFPGAPQARAKDTCDTAANPHSAAPAYSIGATGPKDIVFVVDTSSSMTTADIPGTAETRMEVMQKTIRELLLALTPDDRVQVVSFSTYAHVASARWSGSSASAPTSNEKNNLWHLLPATKENVDMLRQNVSNLVADGAYTNTPLAFQTAFDVLRNSMNTDKSTNCSRLIVTLIDGPPKAPFTASNPYVLSNTIYGVIPAVKAGQTKLTDGNRAHIVMFPMADSSRSLAQAVTCENGGFWMPIVGDPLDEMRQYDSFLQGTCAGADRTPEWRAPAASSPPRAPSMRSSRTPPPCS